MSSFVETSLIKFDRELEKVYTVLGKEPLLVQAATLIELKKQKKIKPKDPVCVSVERAITSLMEIGEEERKLALEFEIFSKEDPNEFSFDFSFDTITAFGRYIRRSKKKLPHQLSNNVVEKMISGPIDFLVSAYDDPLSIGMGMFTDKTIPICMVSTYGRRYLEGLVVSEDTLELIGLATTVATSSHKAVRRYIEMGVDEGEFSDKLRKLELALIGCLEGNGEESNPISDIAKDFGITYSPTSSLIPRRYNPSPTQRILGRNIEKKEIPCPNPNKRKNRRGESETQQAPLQNEYSENQEYLWINLAPGIQKIIRESVVKRGNKLDEFRHDKRTRIGLMVRAFEQIRIGGNNTHYVNPRENGNGVYSEYGISNQDSQIFVVGPTKKMRVLYTVDRNTREHTVIDMIDHQKYDQLLNKKGTES